MKRILVGVDGSPASAAALPVILVPPALATTAPPAGVTRNSSRARGSVATRHEMSPTRSSRCSSSSSSRCHRSGPTISVNLKRPRRFSHGAVVALTALVPLLAGVHPRIASERADPTSTAALEPPGLAGLNYGAQTPLVAIVAHLAYGIALGVLLEVH